MKQQNPKFILLTAYLFYSSSLLLPRKRPALKYSNYNEIFCQGHKKSMHAQILHIFFKFKELYESILKKNEFLADIAPLDCFVHVY